MKKMNKQKQVKKLARFKEFRVQKEMTQREVADANGVTEVTIRHIENGHVKPSLELMFKLARYFETDVYDLFPELSGVAVEVATEA